MPVVFFVSDLHGRPRRYEALFRAVLERRPDAVLLGGDLTGFSGGGFPDLIRPGFEALRARAGDAWPRVLLILGNDDPRALEPEIEDGERAGLWEYVHGKRVELLGHPLYGYAYVPPTPFHHKDWERYDVSRFLDPGCVSPETGYRSVPVPARESRYATIAKDLETLSEGEDLADAIFLFHTPPYQTALDRAALDGQMIDHVPIDVHVGSIAVKRFIEDRQPLLTLHGHVHESAQLTGNWRETIGRTVSVTAAHEGPELALVTFDPAAPVAATRELI